MRKILLLLIILVTFGFVILRTSDKVYSQTETPEIEENEENEFDLAYKAYLESVEEYQNVHNVYILRRSQYLNFKTLRSQQDAHDATVKMLQARDNVIISYLAALKARLHEAIGIPVARSEGLTIRIDEEISWFTNHRLDVPSAGTLDDLVDDSDEAEKQYTTIEPLFYEVLSVIAQGRIRDFTERTEELSAAVDSKIETIRNEDREGYSFSSEKFSNLDRWMFEAQNRITRSKDKQLSAEIAIADYSRRKSGAILSNYNSISSTLGESQLFLKEANTFLKEIIREIKTSED